MTNEDDLLKLLSGNETPDCSHFKELIQKFDNHRILAKLFLLEGIPFVFKDSPMKYTIFREQVADQFHIGSQDVCIVGSAKLGFSPSPHKYGTPFADNSDVDVVVVSDELFNRGSRQLFKELNLLGPQLHEFRDILYEHSSTSSSVPKVALKDWKKTKESVRNFVFQNFNPGLLSTSNPLRLQIFESISSTSGLFFALEPQIFVSKIRARIFRTWRAAENYYSNTLREAKRSFDGHQVDLDLDEGLDGENPNDEATERSS